MEYNSGRLKPSVRGRTGGSGMKPERRGSGEVWVVKKARLVRVDVCGGDLNDGGRKFEPR